MNPVSLGPKHWRSTYRRGEGIAFGRMPNRPWQYMATGTGVTGAAVIATEPMILQINHAGAFDERGMLNAVGRVRIDMHGAPFTQANIDGNFRMTHDLESSLIRISAGDVECRVRAHMELDLILLEIFDGRAKRLPIEVYVELPYHARRLCQGGTLMYLHENGEDTVWHEINVASGMPDDAMFDDALSGRAFGMALEADGALPSGNGFSLAPKPVHRLWLRAEGRKGASFESMRAALSQRPSPEEFARTHAAWFRDFWRRVWFESDDPRADKLMACYDLYRYFTAVSCGGAREFPTRFQIELLSGTLEPNEWAGMQIHSVQTIQAYYGIVRNGDWDALRAFERDYREKRSIYKAYSSNFGACGGMHIPYETNVWGTAYFLRGTKRYERSCGEYNLYHLDENKWGRFSYEHGFAILCFLMDAARARGELEAYLDWAKPQFIDLLRFFLGRYRNADGKLCFTPATSGETWYDCVNPSSWIALFLSRLGELEALGGELRELAQTLREALPPLPIGHWSMEYDGKPNMNNYSCHVDSIVDDASVLLPAERIDRHYPINAENPELYAIWPYGLMGEGLEHASLASRTYDGRYWKMKEGTGWSLDCIWAARLGRARETLDMFNDWLFSEIMRFPGGFGFEASPMNPEMPDYLPLTPSMQGMGNSVCALYEMLCQERGGKLAFLPAWPMDMPVRAAFYTAVAGRVELEYEPGKVPVIRTRKDVTL